MWHPLQIVTQLTRNISNEYRLVILLYLRTDIFKYRFSNIKELKGIKITIVYLIWNDSLFLNCLNSGLQQVQNIRTAQLTTVDRLLKIELYQYRKASIFMNVENYVLTGNKIFYTSLMYMSHFKTRNKFS